MIKPPCAKGVKDPPEEIASDEADSGHEQGDNEVLCVGDGHSYTMPNEHPGEVGDYYPDQDISDGFDGGA
jgi:hypothetical protein